MGFTEKQEENKMNENDENQNKKMPKEKLSNLKQTESKKEENQVTIKSPLMLIKQLIRVLSMPSYEGRLLLSIDQGSKSTLKYMLLNPNICFEEIVSQVRSVILAGGTMKPVNFCSFFFIPKHNILLNQHRTFKISDFEHLIGNKGKIEHFSCGHVIPKENLVCLGLSTGPSGVKFDFSYNSRDNLQIVKS
jgi:chromosome transmission fidelity protein 1